MNGQTFVTMVTLLPASQRRRVVGLLVAVSAPLGIVAILLTPPGTSVATWWPAAAFSVVALMCAGGRRVLAALLVAVVAVVVNVSVGRPLPVAIGFGIANASEAWVVATLASGRTRDPNLVSIGTAIRFLFAALVGSMTIGVLAGATTAILVGDDFLLASTSAMASHVSSVAVLVPLALLKLGSLTLGRPKELLAQIVVLAVFVFVAFAPGQQLPLTFLPFPVMAWAAIRLGNGVLVLESVLVALAITLLSVGGAGPFAIFLDQDARVTTHLIQAYVVIMAGSMLVIAKGETERRNLVARVRSRESVLRGALVGSAGGFLILENAGGSEFRLAALNEQARTLLQLRPGLGVGTVIRARDFPTEVTYHVRRARLTPGLDWDGEIGQADGSTTVRVHVTRVDDINDNYVVVVQAEDTTARTRAASALANALENERATVDRLQELGRQQQDFVAAVSHELRTPLTSIVGFTEELADLELEEPAAGYLDVVLRNTRRLSGLVEDLLYASRMTSTNSQREVGPFDLGALLAETCQDMTPLAGNRGVTVGCQDTEGVGEIDSVRSEVARVLTNLVSNAVKFTRTGGAVRIEADREEHGVTVRIIDDGPGISAEDIERVFERFYRTESAALVPGTGLGLSITRGLAERLGGTVHLESDGENGTTAVLWLPLASPREAADTLPTPVIPAQ